MNTKQLRKAYVEAMVKQYVTKGVVLDAARRANLYLCDEAAMVKEYENGKRVPKHIAQMVIEDVAGDTDAVLPAGELDSIMYDVFQAVQDGIAKELRRRLRISGERVVNLKKTRRGWDVA